MAGGGAVAQLDDELRVRVMEFAGIRGVLCSRLVGKQWKEAADEARVWPVAGGRSKGAERGCFAAWMARLRQVRREQQELSALLERRGGLRKALHPGTPGWLLRGARVLAALFVAGFCGPLWFIACLWALLLWYAVELAQAVAAAWLMQVALSGYDWERILSATCPIRKKLVRAQQHPELATVGGALRHAAGDFGIFSVGVLAAMVQATLAASAPARNPAAFLRSAWLGLALAGLVCITWAARQFTRYAQCIRNGDLDAADDHQRAFGQMLFPLSVLTASVLPEGSTAAMVFTVFAMLLCPARRLLLNLSPKLWGDSEPFSELEAAAVAWLAARVLLGPSEALCYAAAAGEGHHLYHCWLVWRRGRRAPGRSCLRAAPHEPASRHIVWSAAVDFAASSGLTGCRSHEQGGLSTQLKRLSARRGPADRDAVRRRVAAANARTQAGDG